MPLQSILFKGDPKLEAAAQIDAQHIMQGARGPHVGKIQKALNRLDDAKISVDEVYGPATANAVLAYKQKRSIINRKYQTTADSIVGIMTMAALDSELVKFEQSADEIQIWCALASALGYTPYHPYVLNNDHPLRRTAKIIQDKPKPTV